MMGLMIELTYVSPVSLIGLAMKVAPVSSGKGEGEPIQSVLTGLHPPLRGNKGGNYATNSGRAN